MNNVKTLDREKAMRWEKTLQAAQELAALVEIDALVVSLEECRSWLAGTNRMRVLDGLTAGRWRHALEAAEELATKVGDSGEDGVLQLAAELAECRAWLEPSH